MMMQDRSGPLTEHAIEVEIDLDDDQKEAVRRCTDMSPGNRIVAVTGPAGTGKTTIIRIVYERLRDARYRVVLCAPTGKAAKRIYEATGIPAMTIHRLLEYPYPGERDENGKPLEDTIPRRGKNLPLTYDVVIADEYAMVGHEVHRNLLDALPSGGRLMVFGDVNQLRPIESSKILMSKPSPFESLLKTFGGVLLTKLHRQGDGSGIARNGMTILAGRVPRTYDDFDIIKTAEPVDKLRTIVMDAMQRGVDFRSIHNQILSPTKRSFVGTYKLNILLQSMLNPHAANRLSVPRHNWDRNMPIHVGIGDKVIWTENSYDLRDEPDRFEIDEETGQRYYVPTPPDKMILNGEAGIVVSFDTVDEVDTIFIDVGDRVVAVPDEQLVDSKQGLVRIDPRKRIDLAYCITTHKAQGSEYRHVIYVLNKSTYYMQCRPNLYTAVTRARTHVSIITDTKSLQSSVSNVRSPMDKRR